MLFTGKFKLRSLYVCTCTAHCAAWQGAGAHQGNSISNCWEEMLFFACFKVSEHRGKKKREKVEEERCRVVTSTSI